MCLGKGTVSLVGWAFAWSIHISGTCESCRGDSHGHGAEGEREKRSEIHVEYNAQGRSNNRL